MEKQIIYKAKDGKRFDTEQECLAYEKITDEITKLFKLFPPLPKDDHCNFANGGGYIQHNETTYKKVVSGFYALACLYHKELIKYPYKSYGFWTTLDDNGSPFYFYGHRLLNIDEKTFREYGQGYYKLHPSECKGGQIN